MGYSLLSVGKRIRIVSGSFQGVEGTILPPAGAAHTAGTAILRGESELLPVTTSAVIDEQVITTPIVGEEIIQCLKVACYATELLYSGLQRL